MGIFGKKTENEVEKKIATVADESVAKKEVVPDASVSASAAPAATISEAKAEQPVSSIAAGKDQVSPPIAVSEITNAGAPSPVPMNPPERNEIQTQAESCSASATSDTTTNGKKTFRAVMGEQEQYALLNDTEKCQIYAMVFQYGCLGARQIEKVLSRKNISQPDGMETVFVQGEQVYFHTEASLKTYSELSGDTYQEMKKEVVFANQVERNMIPDILKENEILLIYEQAAKKTISLYDWVSSRNPRKNRSLKIPRCDGKHGSLAPDLAIVFHKQSQEYCVILEILPTYSAYLQGEKAKRYWDTIGVYHEFLASQEEREKWVRKVKLDVPADNIMVALIFSAGSNDLIGDLVNKMGRAEIKTSIYLGKIEEVLKRPFSCWYSCHEGGALFKTQKCDRA